MIHFEPTLVNEVFGRNFQLKILDKLEKKIIEKKE